MLAVGQGLGLRMVFVGISGLLDGPPSPWRRLAGLAGRLSKGRFGRFNKEGEQSMGRMAKLSASIRRIWHAAFRRHSRGRGFDKIYSDVRASSYGDIHVMWSILHSSSPTASQKAVPWPSPSLCHNFSML